MIVLYRIYQLFIMLPVVVVSTILTAVVTVIGSSLGGSRWWGYWPAKIWSKIFCWITLVSVSVKGRENIDRNTSYVFVANHQGAYDIFSIYGFLGHNFKWMMKKSLEKVPFAGWACKHSGQIFVDNSTPSAIKHTMEAAKHQLQDGMSLVVFPEGARTFTGKLGRFKRGAYTLAIEFGLPVVPVSINGAYEILPRTGKLPHWGHITLTIHKPIYPGENGHNLQALMDESRQAIEEGLEPRYK